MVKKLSIVVPLRDREEHFNVFVPHLMKYFTYDKADRHIPFSLTFVEQEAGGKFNAGMLRNIGFDLTRDYDYHVFHDIDYLPVWADYSYGTRPARLIWYGAEVRPAAPGAKVGIHHERDKFRGGVIMVPREVFVKANGYANTFWGWGWQDTDMANRCIAEGHSFEKRDGFYQPLDHVSRALTTDDVYRPTGVANIERGRKLAMTMLEDRAYRNDGLSTLKYEIRNRAPVPVKSSPKAPNLISIERVLVHLPGQHETGEEDVVVEARQKAAAGKTAR